MTAPAGWHAFSCGCYRRLPGSSLGPWLRIRVQKPNLEASWPVPEELEEDCVSGAGWGDAATKPSFAQIFFAGSELLPHTLLRIIQNPLPLPAQAGKGKASLKSPDSFHEGHASIGQGV